MLVPGIWQLQLLNDLTQCRLLRPALTFNTSTKRLCILTFGVSAAVDCATELLSHLGLEEEEHEVYPGTEGHIEMATAQGYI